VYCGYEWQCLKGIEKALMEFIFLNMLISNLFLEKKLKVGLERFELSTFRLSAERSSQTELQAHKHTIKIFHLLKAYSSCLTFAKYRCICQYSGIQNVNN
jgi:hypothetical protein